MPFNSVFLSSTLSLFDSLTFNKLSDLEFGSDLGSFDESGVLISFLDSSVWGFCTELRVLSGFCGWSRVLRFLGELDFNRGWGWVFFLAEAAARALDMRASKAEGREDIVELGFRERVWVFRNDGDLEKKREGMRGVRSLEWRVE